MSCWVSRVIAGTQRGLLPQEGASLCVPAGSGSNPAGTALYTPCITVRDTLRGTPFRGGTPECLTSNWDLGRAQARAREAG